MTQPSRTRRRALPMRRPLGQLVVLLLFGGLGSIVVGVLRVGWLEVAWSENDRARGPSMCGPGERFTTWPVRKGIGYFCVDQQGRRRNIAEPLSVGSPIRRLRTWMPVIGGIVAMLLSLLIGAIVVRR